MLLGVIADDFTGASDIANTLAKGLPEEGGLHTTQFLGVPQMAADPLVEAGVISLKSRSIPAKEAVTQSLEALGWLKAQGCSQIIFKYCSTFDSTEDGNIGPVGEALADALDAMGVVACPAFPTAGRTVYQGHLFVHDTLLNESGLENHPINPMSDSNIRRWLLKQTKHPVGLVPMSVVGLGPDAIRAALAQSAANGEKLTIVDAISDSDLITIGAAISDAQLITGGSGIAIGLPRNFLNTGLAAGGSVNSKSVAGPEAILAGSCSGATRGQVARHAEHHPTLGIDVAAVMAGSFGVEQIVEFCHDNEGRKPLCYSSSDPAQVNELQERYGRKIVSNTLDHLFGNAARKLVDEGVKRLIVAGGETSGAVVSALNLTALDIGREIAPGVPALFSSGSERLGLALKSGNFGDEDFFVKALNILEGK